MHLLCSPFLLLLLLLVPPSTAGDSDTITPATPLTDGKTIVSTDGTFELGFFSPENSNNRYIGIWYHNIPVQTVVWVANRATPILDKTGVLTITSNGTLVLSNASNTTFWSSSSSSAAPATASAASESATIANSSSPVAVLLHTGNLVIRTSGIEGWRSFNHPTDTLLPEMKLGGYAEGVLGRNLTAWKTKSDPYPGQYTIRMEALGVPEFFLYRGSLRIYSSGPWNGLQLSGVPDLKSNGTVIVSYVSNQQAYYTYHINNPLTITRLVLNETGVLQRYVWLDNVTGWSLFWSGPKESCDNYAACGPFGFCNSKESPICNCLQGFETKPQQEGRLRDASGGCVRKTRLDCQTDGFLLMKNMKLPQSENASTNPMVSLEQCKELCLKNCSCTAYASADVSEGEGGCIVWAGALIDLQEFDGSGQDLYIRLAASDLVKTEKSGKKRLAIGLGTTASALLLLGVVGYCMRINNAKRGRKQSLPSLEGNRCSRVDLDPLLFNMVTIMAATENFTITNKLGEGGFGPVYKGKLGNGKEIAVKRLSRTSMQGLEEFKNEVILIAKLQHRNLVQHLGCCIHGEEKMLVYEFMHNGSLDTFIFNKTKCVMLNWQRRFDIILGIARGLLYLHQDSRLRIIHRDLKASNVLLDSDMNPKISDFGMARIFGGNQTDAYTRRVVGTYGYMSPEYAMDGIFSMKADVFSFGVLILEIVSGKKNRGMFQSDPILNLLGHTWRLWKEGKSLELLDECLGSSYITSEVMRCIHVSLLCVQEQAGERPTMASVTMMLSSETSNLQQPNETAFVFSNNSFDTKSSETYCTALFSPQWMSDR